jgi:fatty-acid desaturase
MHPSHLFVSFLPGVLWHFRALRDGGRATIAPITATLTPSSILMPFTRGVWYAHLGWMVLKQDSRRAGHVNISDLNAQKSTMFQHRHYLPIAVFFVLFCAPCWYCYFCWNDFWGGLVWSYFCSFSYIR